MLEPQSIVKVLNEALEADQRAVSELMLQRVSCNEALSNHPSIQVRDEGEGKYSVSLLGLLNGLCGTRDDGWGFIVAQVNNWDNPKTREITGFQVHDA